MRYCFSLSSKVKLIADVFGAYFYSIDRPKILSDYYQALVPGGEAYIIIGSEDLHDQETVSYGAETILARTGQNFEELLATRYPSVFSIHTHQRRGLGNANIKYFKISKPNALPLLDLNFSVV